MSDTSRGPRWWRKFRSLPTRWQVASWIGLAVLVIVAAVIGGENGSGIATTAVTQTPTTATPESPASSPTPTASSTVSLAEWRTAHGTNIALVIATANGLVSAIDKADETAITRSCDALKNNYKNLLRPIPAPPGPLGETSGTWDSALDEIYNAQKQCSGGVISNPDLHKAQTEARDGAASLHEVLGPAD